MFGVIAALLLAPQSGILVVDDLALASLQSGQWKPMDSSSGRKTISEGAIKAALSGPAYSLKGKEALPIKNGRLTYGDENAEPGSRGWIFETEGLDEDAVVWLGAKPKAPAFQTFSANSTTYKKAALDYLKKKGLKKPNVLIQTVIQADLDGNGTQEVLIFAASRKEEDIFQAFQGNMPGPKTEDFSMAIIRSVSGKTVKTSEIFYTDGRKGGIEGHVSFGALWDLDGKPGLEIITRGSYYEAWSCELGRFSKGRYTVIAAAGDGV